MITRRSLISGAAAFIAAPAIVRASSLMVIKPERKTPELVIIDGIVSFPHYLRAQFDANGIFLGVIIDGVKDGRAWVRVS